MFGTDKRQRDRRYLKIKNSSPCMEHTYCESHELHREHRLVGRHREGILGILPF